MIKNRDVPVAVIIPYSKRPASARHFSFAQGDGKAVDRDAFDAMDAEVAEMFGV